VLKARVIPCLLLKGGGGLIKTKKFSTPNYIGDPINAVKIYNEKEVDELMFLDITASKERRGPNFEYLKDIASECFIPLCYGGGITTVDEIRKLLRIGIEKVSINSANFANPKLIADAAKYFGSSTVVGSIDVKQNLFRKVRVFNPSTRDTTKHDPVDYARYLENQGAGEILVNSVDRDGMLSGYDFELIKKITDAVNVPVIACGGASGLDDIQRVVKYAGASAAAAGSIFVYQGGNKGVLINYPNYQQLEKILN
jgi:imidazole glycerol-phosphate synthase subunit HisF